jgi:hypothetical protein
MIWRVEKKREKKSCGGKKLWQAHIKENNNNNKLQKRKNKRWTCFPTCYNDQQSENEERKKEKWLKKRYDEKHCYINESTLLGEDNVIASFFKVPMFELQQCHFQEEFSQYFYIL